MNPISELLISFATDMTNETQTEIATRFGLSRAGLKKALDPEKPIESWLVGTLLKLSYAFSMTIIIHAGEVSAFCWTVPLDTRCTNTITPILTSLIGQGKKAQIARQLGLSRRTLYHCLRPDKQVESFKLGTLLKFSAVFAITIIISNGLLSAHREPQENMRAKNKK